jgi:hypothetical protein
MAPRKWRTCSLKRALSIFSIATNLVLGACSGCTFTVPASSLQAWPGYPVLSANIKNTVSYPWLILKCTYADEPNTYTLPSGLNPAINNLDTYINLFLTLGGAGTGNLTDYYFNVTYGLVTFDGTRVYGWYPAPFTLAQVKSNSITRTSRVEQCADALLASVDGANFDFSSFWGILVVMNVPQDAGECQGPNYGQFPLQLQYPNKPSFTVNLACVILDPDAFWTAFAAHEVGHGLGLPHSWDEHCEYCDQFDVMSALDTWQSFWPNYPPEGAETGQSSGIGVNCGCGGFGPGLNVPNLLFLKAIPQDRISTYQIGNGTRTFLLTALSHPVSPGSLAVEIVGSNPNDIYTIEYRQAEGWDQSIGSNLVLIHEYKVGAVPYSFLQDGPSIPNGGNVGGWSAGTTWTDSTLGVSVKITKIDPSNAAAIITVSQQ